MERVAFLDDRTGERIACLLNPESMVVRRNSGVRVRSGSNRPLAGAELSDDPLLFTGGGSTTLDLDLLFDVSLAGSSVPADDVRELTGPLWRLAENDVLAGRPPRVHFVWGKTWSLTGVIVAVAERLESFTPEGAPRRSWMRMRMRRVAEDFATTSPTVTPPNFLDQENLPLESIDFSPTDLASYELAGDGPSEGEDSPPATERLDQLANSWFGNPAAWRLLAVINDIDDPLRLEAGKVIRIPGPRPAEGTP